MSKEKISPFTSLGASNHYGDREKDDFYSTPKIAVEKLINILEKYNINLADNIIDPGVGSGGILNSLMEKYPNKIYFAFDIKDRGFSKGVNVIDFLTIDRNKIMPDADNKNISIVANFPYKDILNQSIHSLEILKEGEYLIHLAKIQYLEGKARRELFKENPPKYVFIFSDRIKCLNNDIDDGSSSAMCFAWFVFEKGFKGSPTIDWL